jgi:hypothetical protein
MEAREQVSNEALFMGLVINLHATAMIALGKITSPLTQKIERNLEQARFTIDMLGMLEAKTAGNRTEEETRTLRTILTELRLNYVDELEKDAVEQKKRDGAAEGVGSSEPHGSVGEAGPPGSSGNGNSQRAEDPGAGGRTSEATGPGGAEKDSGKAE